MSENPHPSGFDPKRGGFFPPETKEPSWWQPIYGSPKPKEEPDPESTLSALLKATQRRLGLSWW